MVELRLNVFDSTLGVDSESTWLDRKVLRRELTQDLNRESLTKRVEHASQAAETFKDDLSRKAQLRTGIEKKSAEVRRREEEILKRQADEFREKLRRKLPSELRFSEPER